MDGYVEGIMDGMLIQAVSTEAEDIESKKVEEQMKGFRLAIELIGKGKTDIIENCLCHPEDIDFYCNLFDII